MTKTKPSSVKIPKTEKTQKKIEKPKPASEYANYKTGILKDSKGVVQVDVEKGHMPCIAMSCIKRTIKKHFAKYETQAPIRSSEAWAHTIQQLSGLIICTVAKQAVRFTQGRNTLVVTPSDVYNAARVMSGNYNIQETARGITSLATYEKKVKKIYPKKEKKETPKNQEESEEE